AGDSLADARDQLEGIELVECVETRQVDRGKFKAKESAADPQNTVGLFQCTLDARHVADAERDSHAVEAAFGIGEFLGVALLEGNDAVEPPLRSTLVANLEHVGVDVANRGARAGAARVRYPKSHVACTAGEIEQRKRPVVLWRVYCRYQCVLPGTVQPARHQVVHEVVTAGD